MALRSRLSGVAGGFLRSALAAAISAAPAAAQVVVDDTFGAAGPVGAGTDPTGQSATYLISGDLGEQRGHNLFHSFDEFSVGADETATFTDAGLAAGRDEIHHVFSRVTGGNPSQIDGTIRSTVDQADVWLMNPNGVVFGDGARLDVPGGFHASTASWLDFHTGEKFEVQLGGTIPILEVAAPTEFGFLGPSAGDLLVDGSILSVRAGETLELGGGNVRIDRAVLSADTTSEGAAGTILVTARDGVVVSDSSMHADTNGAGQAGSVLIDAGYFQASRAAISADSLGRQNTGMGNAGHVSVTARAGSVQIDDSFITVDAVRADAGSFTISASGDFSAMNSAVAANSARGNGGIATLTVGGDLSLKYAGLEADSLDRGDGGVIEVHAGSLWIEESKILAQAKKAQFRSGDGGSITLAIDGDLVMIHEPSDSENAAGISAFSSSATGGTVLVIAGGDVDLRGGTIASGTFGGAGGLVEIRCFVPPCSNSLVMQRQAAITAGTDSAPFAPGSAGTIKIQVGRVDVDGLSVIGASSYQSDGGVIDISASESVRIANTGGGPLDFSPLIDNESPLVSGLFATSGGAGGRIEVRSPLITLEEGGIIASGGVGVDIDRQAAGGSILLDGDEIRILSGAGVDSSAGFADAGEIVIVGSRSVLIEGTGPDGASRVRALALGTGAGGRIQVTSPEIVLRGGVIATSSIGLDAVGAGPAGAITLSGRDLTIEGGTIDASSFGRSEGGNISISMEDTISLEGASARISARAGAEGDGGLIAIQSNTLSLGAGATITTESRAGLAELEPVFDDLLELTDIVLEILGRDRRELPSIATGDGGSITIEANEVELTGGSSIASIASTASSADGGNITLLVAERIHLTDSAIRTDVAAGDGGAITIGIDEDALTTKGGSMIEPDFVTLNNSRILANAGRQGGTIRVRAETFVASAQSVVNAESAQAPELDGTVEINAPDVDLTGSLAQLPEAVLDASALAAQRCSARRTGETAGSFVVSGRDGAAPGPDGLLPAAFETSGATGVALAGMSGGCR